MVADRSRGINPPRAADGVCRSPLFPIAIAIGIAVGVDTDGDTDTDTDSDGKVPD
jgi:hypothetical protein